MVQDFQLLNEFYTRGVSRKLTAEITGYSQKSVRRAFERFGGRDYEVRKHSIQEMRRVSYDKAKQYKEGTFTERFKTSYQNQQLGRGSGVMHRAGLEVDYDSLSKEFEEWEGSP